MNQLDPFISPIVQEQFPQFYKEEGPLFVLFAEEYFKWLETSGSNSTAYHSRKLLEYGDIDQTVDSFIVYFKQKYLKGVEFDVLTNKKLLIKSALDLFRSKGSERSIDLLFKLVYGTKIEIFTPGDQILKLSDGKWVVPVYLELTRSDKTKTFVGKQITGSKSKATAVVEHLITRNIKGNLIDIVYLSSLTGSFLVNDIINTGGSVEGCPKVTGSLSTIDITTQGQGFSVGEEVNLVSARGVEGKARVTGIEVQTGVVQFLLIDGGWGFSTTANTIVSTKVLSFSSDLDFITSPDAFQYVSNNMVYSFDKFAFSACLDALRQYKGQGSTDTVFRSFLNTVPTGSSYKLNDTNNNGALDVDDILNFLRFGHHDTAAITASFANWMRFYVMPTAVSNTYIVNNYLDVFPQSISKFSTVTQSLYNITVNNIIGEVSNTDILVTETGNTCAVVSSNKSAYTNTALLIVAPVKGDVLSASSLAVIDRSVIVANDSITFNLGDTVHQTNSTSETATGIVTQIRPVSIVSISGGTSTNTGLTVGNYVYQADSDASGYISATPRESNYGAVNVAIIAVSNTQGTFNNSSALSVYSDNSNTTVIATATSSGAETGYMYYLSSAVGDWSTGNTVYTTNINNNTSIKIASLVGGTYTTYSDITATGNVIGSNTSSVGVVDIQNTFYGTGVSKLSVQMNGNTYLTPNVSAVSTGTSASFLVGVLSDAETVLLSPDRMSSNNDGPGSNSIQFTDMLISGGNSTFGYLTDILIVNGGSGYDNTDIITFSGNTTGYDAGNGTIVTDSSGVITGTSLSANTGSGYYATPTVTIVTSGGTGAELVPLAPLGFPKLPVGDLSYLLLDLLSYEAKTIGTISSLTGINPGENYNTDPFVLAYEPSIASYDLRDYVLQLANVSGSFANNELVYQYNTIDTVTITGNNYTGNTTTFDTGEYVYSLDGANTIAEGTVRVATDDFGTHTVIIENATGTFLPSNNTVTYKLYGITSNSQIDIISANNTTSTTATAKGRVSLYDANTGVLEVKRTSVFNEYQANNTNQLVGLTTSTTAEIVSVVRDTSKPAIGINSDIQANVVIATGAISNTKLISSGFGYAQDETVSLVSLDGERVATGKANIVNEGREEGRYVSYDGFTDNYRYIHDGEYYQEYSYEVQSSVPFDKYSDLLKQVLHVAGTKMFGRFVTATFTNNAIAVANSSITQS